MDIHIASNNSPNSLPQGFSVYQPALGAQLQFFPAMGTKELDDLLHSYLPGPAPIADKRAAVSVDFLEHLHLTGQTFKFYQVEAAVVAPSASASSSPASGSSSLSGFPATPTWDFNNIAYTPSPASSQTSTSGLKARKSAKHASVSRHQTTDFSHLPGMKIMTRDGIDVTNAASRGSKTKEQRDHAHLMRIIKACDSCRSKKIRCDPSHKRKTTSSVASSSTPAPAPPSTSRQKRQKALSKISQPVISQLEHLPTSSFPAPSLAPVQDFNWDEFDASMNGIGFDNFDDFAKLDDTWADFIHYPEMLTDGEYHNFLDFESNVSPQSSFTPATTSPGTSTKPHSPNSTFASVEPATSSLPVTNRSTSADEVQDSWSSELDFASPALTGLQTERSVQSALADDGVIRAAMSDGSGVPGDHGLDATLLSSTDTVQPLHRLEDPGTFANTASLPELVDPTTFSSSLATSSPSEGSADSNHRGAHGRQATLSVQSPAEVFASPTSATIRDPARALRRASPDSAAVDVAVTATQSRSQALAGIGDRAGILSLLPVSGPAVPGLAQLMLGGTSELIAASAPLSSKETVALLWTLAVMATSFVASVDSFLAHVRLDQASLIGHNLQSRKVRTLPQQSRCRPVAHPASAMTPSLVGAC